MTRVLPFITNPPLDEAPDLDTLTAEVAAQWSNYYQNTCRPGPSANV